MRNTSLSFRLTAWFSAIFLGGFVLFGVVMWLDLAYSLAQGRDRTLTRRSVRIAELLDASAGDSESTRMARFLQLTEVIPEGNLIEVVSANGTLLLPREQKSPDFPWPTLTALAGGDQFSDVEYHEREYRLYRRLYRHPQHPCVILVAGQLEDNRNMMARFALGLAWTTPAMLVLSAVAGYFLNQRALQPVDQVTAMLRSISIGNLSQRLPVSGTRDELQSLAETCNAMLVRLEDAVERINRFTADASHELRSPVALIRAVAEYALRNPNMDAGSQEAFEEILAESVETGQLLEDMLTLARADAGHFSNTFEAVDIAQLVEDAVARQPPLALAKRQTVSLRTGGAAWVSGDRSSLRRLVWILLDNAVKYTPIDGRIEVTTTVINGAAVLTVRDSGIGIPEELLPRIFDRFVRADPSRGEVNGTGLGLAIAKWIAGVHRAKLSVQSREREGSIFRVEFPLLRNPE